MHLFKEYFLRHHCNALEMEKQNEKRHSLVLKKLSLEKMLLGQQLREQAWCIRGGARLHFLQCPNNVNCIVRYYLSKKLRPWVDKKKRTLERYIIDRAERVWVFYYDAKCFCCSCQGTRIFLQYSFYWDNLGVHKHTYFKIKVWMYHVLSRFSRV